jgi:hypothetical protein
VLIGLGTGGEMPKFKEAAMIYCQEKVNLLDHEPDEAAWN